MKIDVQQLDVHNNQAASRFEVALGDELGVIEYQKDGSVYIFTHTEVPAAYEGQGIANQLAHAALETAKAEGAQVIPLCPFVNAYIRRHKEYEALVALWP